MRLIKPALLSIALVTIGCASFKSYPTNNVVYDIFPQAREMSDNERRQVLDRQVLLPSQIVVGIAWLNQRAGGFGALPDAERGRLLSAFAERIQVAPVWRSVVLPTMPTGGYHDGAAAADLGALQSAAARFMSDVLIILNTSTNEYVDWNPLALSYLAILPVYFFPGDDLSVYASAEACAVDVRSGVFLGCAQGQDHRERGFVTRLRRDAVVRDLSSGALETALAGIPEKLRAQIATYTGSLVFPPNGPGIEPKGPTYRTGP